MKGGEGRRGEVSGGTADGANPTPPPAKRIPGLHRQARWTPPTPTPTLLPRACALQLSPRTPTSLPWLSTQWRSRCGGPLWTQCPLLFLLFLCVCACLCGCYSRTRCKCACFLRVPLCFPRRVVGMSSAARPSGEIVRAAGNPRPLYSSKCKSVFYCSQDCQLKDWQLGHKLQCRLNIQQQQAARLGAA